MVDIRQSLQYAKYLSSLGWTVERIDEVNYFVRKFPLIGSILKVQRPEKTDLETIDKLCRKYRVFQVILEPGLTTFNGTIAITERYHKLLYTHSFRSSKSPYLPTKTLQIDLTQTRNEIFRHFKKDTRATIKKSFDLSNPLRTNNREVKNAIHRYSSPKDIIRWREAWKNSVKFDRYVPPARQLINLRKSFPDNYSLFLASHNMSGSVIGGALFTISSHERSNYISYYWYAFTNKEGRASLSQYSLLYQGILWAKKQGCKVFDFEGVYDPRFPNKSWLGFSHFKKSFGGYEVEYPGCYTKFRLPL